MAADTPHAKLPHRMSEKVRPQFHDEMMLMLVSSYVPYSNMPSKEPCLIFRAREQGALVSVYHVKMLMLMSCLFRTAACPSVSPV